MLSIAILSAFTIFGLIILPALAEYLDTRTSRHHIQDQDDVRLPDEDEPGDLLAAA